MDNAHRPLTREALLPIVAALLEAERRIAMLERRLQDARWLGPGEAPNAADKETARVRVAESIGALLAPPPTSNDVDIDDL